MMQYSAGKEENYLREFIRYVSMNIISMIGLSIYILADTYFVSKGLGANGLAALNLALPAYNLVNGCGLMLGVGGAALFIGSRTSGDRRRSDGIFTSVLLAGLIIGGIFLVCGILFSGPMARMLGADADTFANTQIYLKMIWIFAPAFLINNILSAFVKNDGNPRLAMTGMLAGSLFNIVFDYVFIFPLHLGMFGAVLATVFSPVVGILLLSGHFRSGKNAFSFSLPAAGIRYFAGAVSAGIPSLVMEVASGVVMLVFNILILDLAGNNGVAAYGVMANILLVIIAIYNGIAQGAQPLFGRTFAAGDRNDMLRVWRYALLTVTAFSALFYAVTFLFPGPLTSVFNSEGNRALQKIAVSGFMPYFSQCFFLGLNTIMIMFLISAGRNRTAQLMSLLKGFILVIPLAFVMSRILGLTGIWLTMGITEFAVSLIGIRAVRNVKHSSRHTQAG